MTATADAVVLGAGPAGLAVAYGLGRAGRSVDVVERAPVVGGLASSFEVGGVRVDHGSHLGVDFDRHCIESHRPAALRGI